jgi:ribosomal protein S18 acetylase RimI-like enzyme
MVPNLKYKIEKADTKDLSELAELGKRLCLEMRSIDPTGMDLKKGFEKEISKWQASSINKKKCLFLKAVVNNRIVGYLFCEIQDRLPIFKSDPGHIYDIYILPVYRNKGMGSALISEAMKWFREKGIKRVTIDSLAKNPGATRMYERMKFISYRLKLGLKV